jgi:hypothetical protein
VKLCYHGQLHDLAVNFIFLQNNVTPNNTPLQPLNGDSPATPDSVPVSRKRPSDTPIGNSRKKAKTGEENLNQVCVEVGVWEDGSGKSLSRT